MAIQRVYQNAVDAACDRCHADHPSPAEELSKIAHVVIPIRVLERRCASTQRLADVMAASVTGIKAGRPSHAWRKNQREAWG